MLRHTAVPGVRDIMPHTAQPPLRCSDRESLLSGDAMKKPAEPQAANRDADGDDRIAAYSETQTAAFQTVCELLRELIDSTLPKASSKIWHGSPVWFIDENPVVGYSANAKAVSLLFWNGRAFDEPELRPVGKYRAAQAKFVDASAIDPKVIRRWLKKAKSDIFDSRAFFQKLRANKQ